MAGNHNSGRAKKPAVLKLTEGNRGRRRIQNEPVPDGRPKMPDYFTDEQRRTWLATLQYLPKGLVTGADSAFVEIYAVAWSTYREAQRAITKTGKLVKGSEGQPVTQSLACHRPPGRRRDQYIRRLARHEPAEQDQIDCHGQWRAGSDGTFARHGRAERSLDHNEAVRV